MRCFLLTIVLAALAALTPLHAGEKSTEFKNGVVVAVSEPGAEAGLTILKQGGNAVDAAITTALALAVTRHPSICRKFLATSRTGASSSTISTFSPAGTPSTRANSLTQH